MANQVNQRELHGLNILGEPVAIKPGTGALYQVVPGDPTNEDFIKVVQEGAQQMLDDNGGQMPSLNAATSIATLAVANGEGNEEN